MKKIELNAALSFLSEWLNFQVGQSNIVGLSVAVAHKSEIVFNRSYGFADLESDEKLTPDHAMNIGSQAKMFTATAVLLLAESGKVDIKQKAAEYLPWLKRHSDKRFSHITIEQLLTHRAGLARDGDDARFWHMEAPFPDEDQLKKIILKSKTYVEGYVKYKYSNLGYALLGLIIEKTSGVSFADFVQKAILQPLELKKTFAEFSQSNLKDIATSYSAAINGKRYPINRSVYTNCFTPVAGIYSTPQDMCRFLSANFYGDFLPKEIKAGLHNQKFNHWLPQIYRGSTYGAGFFLADFNDRKIVGHSGGFTGYRTATFYDPQTQVTVSVSNTTREVPVYKVLNAVLSVFDFFYKNGSGDPMLNVVVRNLWVNIMSVSTKKAVFLLQTDNWEPFSQSEELEQIEPNKFKIKRASDNSYLGETVEFVYKKSELDHINYAGLTLRSKKSFDAWLRDFTKR